MINNEETENNIYSENIIEEIQKLEKILEETGSKDAFLKQIDYLMAFVKEPTIYDGIYKLKKIYKSDGCNQRFKLQLDYLVDFLNKKFDKFIPINDKFIEFYKNQAKETGISFLVPELDRLTGGIQKGTITTIVGGPGCMKTTLAVNICYNAIKEGKNVCYLTLEETPFQLYCKVLSRASIDIGKQLICSEIVQNRLSEEDKQLMFNEVYPYFESLPGLFYMVGENNFISMDTVEIEKLIKEIDKMMKIKSQEKTGEIGHGIDLLVVDHIQLLKYIESTKDEFQVINSYVSFFRRMSLSFLHQDKQISVILLSQCNREGIKYAQKHDGGYQMQHVAEASEIERSSTYVISTYTDTTNQISKILKVGAIKLRGAPLPLDTLNTYADGRYYCAGERNSVPKAMDYESKDITPNDELELNNNLNDMLGELFV